MSISDLPTLNAILNSLSATLLVVGYVFIRQKKINAHRTCMVSAFVTSTLFLISYLFYHYHHGATRFTGQGAVRALYLTILLTHTVLAVVIVPLIFITFARALRARFDKHRAIARWTLPLWLYVSVTGVIVYLMLYHLYPAR
jgi:putative membrane protein